MTPVSVHLEGSRDFPTRVHVFRVEGHVVGGFERSWESDRGDTSRTHYRIIRLTDGRYLASWTRDERAIFTDIWSDDDDLLGRPEVMSPKFMWGVVDQYGAAEGKAGPV